MMKEKKYRSNATKGVLIAAAHLAMVTAVVCAIVLAGLYREGLTASGFGNLPYTQTSHFSEEVCSMARTIVQNIGHQKVYRKLEEEKGGVIADITEVAYGSDVSYENTSGVAYFIDDLLKWAESGWEAMGPEAESDILVCEKEDGTYYYYHTSEFLNLAMYGKLDIVLNEEASYSKIQYVIEDLVESIRNAKEGLMDLDWDSRIRSIKDTELNQTYRYMWFYRDNLVVEKYAPVGADSLMDAVNDSAYWNGRLSDAYDALASTLANIPEYKNSLENMEQYSEGNTNLTYFYADEESKTVFTNNPSYENYADREKTLEDIAKSGAYLIVSPKLTECETNMDTNLQIWQHLAEQEGGSSNYTFAVSVDEGFPVEDVLASKNEAYDKYSGWTIPLMAAGIAGVVIFFAALVWLTAIAGRSPKDEKLHLCAFDNWFTEIAAAAVAGLWVACMCVVAATGVINREMKALSVTAAILTLFSVAIFLTGYLSLVRRVKAGILWENSLLKRLLGVIRRGWKKGKKFFDEYSKLLPSVPKMVLSVGGFLLLQLILCAMIFSGGAVMFLVLLLVDGAMIVYCIKKAGGRQIILNGLKKIAGGELQYKIPLDKLKGDQKTMAEYINNIGEGLDAAVEKSLKDERMKTELITNVSHDIKTPLTSIINYIDLLKRENFDDPTVCGYLEVLEAKAQRLKVLTEDVVEASKVSTGNISLEMNNLNFVEMVHQVMGEFEEKFQQRNLTMVADITEKPVIIYADGRRMWRVLENIFNNAAKYAMEGTRVYIDLKSVDNQAVLSMKNISEQPLNISADELTERFIRGDVSRSTEGSGLGLSIAKSLAELQGGTFQLYLDGDLFKATIIFPVK